MKIYIVGSVAYDRIMSFSGRFSDHILPDKVHVLNVSFCIQSLIERFGGTAGNIAYTLALLEESPVVIASVGTDYDPSYQKHFKKLGLPEEGLHLCDQFLTAGAYIMTDQANCQITAFNPGASIISSNFTLDAPDSQDLFVISPTDTKEMFYYYSLAKKHKIPWIFDPGQQLPALTSEELVAMITGAQMLVSNDYEFALICEKTGLTKKQLHQLTPVIITTLGEYGCDVHTPTETKRIPAIPVNPVKDPTGAGDAFRSGLIKGYKMGRTIYEAAEMGIVAASYAVEQEGTQEHYFTPDLFWQRYRHFFTSIVN